MSSSTAAELSAAAEGVAGYRRRVVDLVGPQLGPGRDDLVAAIYEAERSLRTSERLLSRALKLAGGSVARTADRRRRAATAPGGRGRRSSRRQAADPDSRANQVAGTWSATIIHTRRKGTRQGPWRSASPSPAGAGQAAGGADVLEHAPLAGRAAGLADPPAVEDQAQRERTPPGPGQERVEIPLDLHRVGLLGRARGVRRPAGRGCRPASRAARTPPSARCWPSCGRRRGWSRGRRGGWAPRRRSARRGRRPCPAAPWSSAGRSRSSARAPRPSPGRRRPASAGPGYRPNSAGVTRLTRASVVWADRIVAASSSNALRCSSSQSSPGYASASRRAASPARPLGVRGPAMA